MLRAVEFTALEGRTTSKWLLRERILPRFPMTVGVFVMLLVLAMSRGRGVRVQLFVVLRQ